MPLKGPVLADQFYPYPFLRQTEDLDVLVRPADVRRAERALEGLGYRRCAPHEQGADYHTRFEADGVIVELHHDLAEDHVSRIDVRGIWTSAQLTSWAGYPMWSMAVPDLLLYLAFHASKDGLGSLRPLLDIALLVKRHAKELPWDELVVRVKTAQLSFPVYLSLSESRALVEAAVPADFLDAVRPRHLSGRLGQGLFRWRGGVLDVPDDLLVGPFMSVLMLLWEDSLRGKLRHLRRNLLPSATLRARWTSLPSSVSWLIWYPVWLGAAGRCGIRQLAARASRPPRPRA